MTDLCSQAFNFKSMEVATWLFVSMIVALIAAGIMIDLQYEKIKKLKKKLKIKE